MDIQPAGAVPYSPPPAQTTNQSTLQTTRQDSGGVPVATQTLQSVAATGQSEAQQPGQDATQTAGQSTAQTATAKPPSSEEVKHAVDMLNNAVNALQNVSLQFSVDSSTKQTVVKVVDASSGQVIRQIPSEQALQMSKALDNFLQGNNGSLMETQTA